MDGVNDSFPRRKILVTMVLRHRKDVGNDVVQAPRCLDGHNEARSEVSHLKRALEVEPDSTPKESMLRCSGKLSWVRLVIDGEDLPDAMQERV